MKRTCHTSPWRLAPALVLLVIAALLLSGLALPAAQAAPDSPHATTIIAVLSDYGSGTALEQTVATMIAGWSPARIVTAGDNYHYQSCSTYATCVGAYYGTYVTAQTFMPAMGNHDYDSTVGLTAWNNYFTWLPTSPDAQRRWYDFVVGDVHFFILDGNGNQATQSTWLSTAVPASTSAWNIAVIHQAPYSTGNYGDIAASQLPYGQYGIDFVISGHNHHFERLVKADGGKTVCYFIDGYGGSLPSGLGHSECGTNSTTATSEYCLAETPGAIKITASDTSITFQYYDSSGAVRHTYEEVIGPEITTSVSTLSPFSTLPGTASAPQTYTVAGSLLTEDISIAAPAGFEIKTDSGAYGPTITLPQTGGVVNPTTISVRLTGTAEGNFAGNIEHTSGDATQKDVAVRGYVGTAPPCTDVSLVVTEDTHMRSGNTRASYNYGGSTTIRVNPFYEQGSTDGQLTGALLKWDLSGEDIPADATISAASLTFNVTTGSNYAYGLYNMRRAWVEGNNNGTTGSGASWNYYGAGTGSWGTTGAQNTSSDRYDTNLWDATAGQFNTTGSVTFDLNDSGRAVIEGWVAGTLSNYGLTIQNYSGTTVDVWEAASSENGTEANRPRLNLTYCPSTNPAIITSVSSLPAFNTAPGTPSAAQTYTVSGKNLTADISIAAPSGFEISTDGTNYFAGLSLTPTGGVVGTTTIYARLTGAAGTWSGNIAHTSAGAVTKNVAVSGTASSCYDVALVAAADTYMSSYNSTNNYGAQTYMRVTLGTYARGSLIQWDLSSIPANAVVSAVSLQLYVSTAGSATYNLYNMRRAWMEGTGSGSATGDGATWQTYDGTNAWGTNGAANTPTDRDNTNLWGAGSSTFATTGSKTVALNADGQAVVQGWVDGSVDNYGLTIQNYGTGTTDVQFSTRNNATEANRPKLTITYCTPPPAARPKAPVVTSIVLSGSNDVTLTWDEVTQDVNNNPTDITAYRVYGSHDPFFDPVGSDLLDETTDVEFTSTHTGGSTGDTNWYYLVRAVNAGGESANSPRRTGRFGFLLTPGTAGP